MRANVAGRRNTALVSPTDQTSLLLRGNRRMLIELIQWRILASELHTPLGILWGLLAPLSASGVIYLTFSRRFSHEPEHFLLYIFSGVLSFGYFARSTQALLRSLIENRNLLGNTTISPLVVSLAVMTLPLQRLLVEMCILVAVGMWIGSVGSSTIPFIAIAICSLTAVSVGVGLALAIGACFFRDLVHIWHFATGLLFLLTPVFYRADGFGSARVMALQDANPLIPGLASVRAMVGLADPTTALLVNAGVTGLLVAGLGYLIFRSFVFKAVERI